MKLLDPIPETSIPEKLNFSPNRNSFYDEILATVSTLDNLFLPVECESKKDVSNLLTAMKGRNLKAFSRGLIVYVGKKEE